MISETLSRITGTEVYTMVKICDVNELVQVENYEDIQKRLIKLKIITQSKNTPEIAKRPKEHKDNSILINKEADYLCLLKQNWNWHYISNMVEFVEAVKNSNLHIGDAKTDGVMADFTRSKIIVPIRCEMKHKIIGKVQSVKEGDENSFDLIGFLVAYSNERNAFRPNLNSEMIYCNYLSMCADALYKMLERIRTYQKHSNDFTHYEEGHKKAKISEAFMI